MIRKFAILIFILGFVLPVQAVAIDNNSYVTVTQLLKTTSSWDGKPIVYPDGQAEITGLIVELAPGGETGWHQHTVPSFGLLLEGTLEVTLKDGRMKRLNAGDALAEVVDTLHNGRNVGKTPVKIVVFYAGSTGKALTIKQNVQDAAVSKPAVDVPNK